MSSKASEATQNVRPRLSQLLGLRRAGSASADWLKSGALLLMLLFVVEFMNEDVTCESFRLYLLLNILEQPKFDVMRHRKSVMHCQMKILSM